MPREKARTLAARILENEEPSLLDLLDNALNKGIVLNGDVTLALAQVDLVYVRLSLLLCAADRILPPEDAEPGPARRSRPPRRP